MQNWRILLKKFIMPRLIFSATLVFIFTFHPSLVLSQQPPNPIGSHFSFPDRITCRVQSGAKGLMLVDLWKQYTQQYNRDTGMIVNVLYLSSAPINAGLAFRGPLPIDLNQTKVGAVPNWVKIPDTLCKKNVSIQEFIDAGQAAYF